MTKKIWNIAQPELEPAGWRWFAGMQARMPPWWLTAKQTVIIFEPSLADYDNMQNKYTISWKYCC